MSRPIFILFILLASCTQNKQTKNELSDTGINFAADTGTTAAIDSLRLNSELISCTGIGNIKLSDNMAGLIKKAGQDSIIADSLFLEGSFEGIVSKLWKNTPYEITVRWNEREAPYRTIRFLEIREGSVYHFSNGIGIGTSLEEVVRLNEAPVSFYGFAWDYGGTFTGFNEGKLAREIPCFDGVFTLPIKGSIAVNTEIVGDKKIRSDNPALEGFDIKLSVIRINRKKTQR